MPNALRIGLLGPLQVRDETGRPVRIGGSQLRVLLSLLALNAGRVVPAGSLAGHIWPDDPPGHPGNALQTLVSRLADSPAGQLAWILDKFREWTHPREALPDTVIGRDRLLTNVMIYWLTRTAGSAAYAGYAQPSLGHRPGSSGVPTAAIMFAHDVGIRRYAETSHNITTWTGRSPATAALRPPGSPGPHQATRLRPARAVRSSRSASRPGSVTGRLVIRCTAGWRGPG